MGTGAFSDVWQLDFSQTQGDILYRREDEKLGFVVTKERSGTRLIAFGDSEAGVAELRARQSEGLRPERSLISSEIHGALDSDLRGWFGPNWGFRWEQYYSFEPLPEVQGMNEVRFVSREAVPQGDLAAQIERVLEVSNPITDARTHVQDFDWYLLFGPDGTLASVMAAQSHDGVSAFHALGTDPAYRGLGLGSAVMVGAVNHALQTHRAIRFGMWSWNSGAARLYERLGLTHGGSFIIGRQEPFPDLQSQATRGDHPQQRP